MNETKFDCKGQRVKQKRFNISAFQTEKFRKENAIRLWAKIFDDLNLDYEYLVKLNLTYGGKMQEADFFIENENIPVCVQGCRMCDGRSGEAKEIALATNGDVLVAYADGRFKLMCYFTEEYKIRTFRDYEDRIETRECAELCDEATLNTCSKCRKLYFTAKECFQGCRYCGNELDNTVVMNGDEDVTLESIRVLKETIKGECDEQHNGKRDKKRK